MDLEEIFKGAVSIIVLIVFLGAMIPLFGQLGMGAFYSSLIGLMFLAIVVAFLIKILKELGVDNVF